MLYFCTAIAATTCTDNITSRCELAKVLDYLADVTKDKPADHKKEYDGCNGIADSDSGPIYSLAEALRHQSGSVHQQHPYPAWHPVR